MMIGPNNASIGAPSPGPPGPGMSPVQLAFSDFLSCAQHGPLVYGLSCMLQVSTQLRFSMPKFSVSLQQLGWE
jgi:mediator of RNA polymerase II transcription subunit 12